MPYILSSKAPYQDRSQGKHIFTDAQVASMPKEFQKYFVPIVTTKTGKALFERRNSAPQSGQPQYLAESDYDNLPLSEKPNYVELKEFTDDEWKKAYN